MVAANVNMWETVGDATTMMMMMTSKDNGLCSFKGGNSEYDGGI